MLFRLSIYQALEEENRKKSYLEYSPNFLHHHLQEGLITVGEARLGDRHFQFWNWR